MNKRLIKSLSDLYTKNFDSSGSETIVFSPGRINVLGEHVDYNDGLMLPAAIDLGIYFIGDKRDDSMVHLHSVAYNETVIIDVSKQVVKCDVDWANYIIGVIAQFQKKDIPVPGFNLVFNGDIPIGAGLSSSAALECGVGLFINHIADLALSRVELALMAQKAEHEFAGVNCGIMDQMASILGKENMVIQLDAQSLDFEYVPLDLKNYGLVLIDSQVKHELASSEYNVRRQECQDVLERMKEVHAVRSFRECSIGMLDTLNLDTNSAEYRRGKYVLEEIERVFTAVKSIQQGAIEGLGTLMNETHEGLSNDYEVSCVELDFLHDKALEFDEVAGCRMMGGGFGGCTINLMEKAEISRITEKIADQFHEKFDTKPKIIPVHLSRGTTILNLNELL